MNPNLLKLQPYPFGKLAALKAGITADPKYSAIALSIGEPGHPPPAFVLDTYTRELASVAKYPATQGTPGLRQTIHDWATRRFQLSPASLTAEHHILPVNGTREALFAFAQATIDASQSPLVFMPNPFYQIYEGAALLAGAEPLYLNLLEDNHYQPDFDNITERQWQRCQLMYLCSPNNPTGSVITLETWQRLIELADKYQFIIASDECYSEVYPDENRAPTGLLEACAAMGRDDFKHCVVFQSLSKRSNLPGLRSGFVAGDAAIIKTFLQYRTYHGCAMSLPVQMASIVAWQDETHVKNNRRWYREKFAAVMAIVKPDWPLRIPEAGFNFWAKTPLDDELFAQQLFAKTHITVLPGRYLSREADGFNPGKNHVRMAMVAPLEECTEAARRIKQFVQSL